MNQSSFICPVKQAVGCFVAGQECRCVFKPQVGPCCSTCVGCMWCCVGRAECCTRGILQAGWHISRAVLCLLTGQGCQM